MRDPRIEKVFHAAEYDILCLKRDYGFELNGLFDTMASARMLGAKELGLAALISKYFGIQLSKKLQRADWGKRPLSDAQIDYARLDTHYLLRLRDFLYQELEKKGLLHDAKETFMRLEQMEHAQKPFNPDDFWRLPGARHLNPQSRAVLREIFYFREKTAAETDKAPFRVLPEALMVRLAERLPKDLVEVEKVPGITTYLLKRFGRELLDLVQKGLSLPPIESPPERKPTERWNPSAMLRYQSLRQWRKKKAEERGLDPVVILPTDDLRRLAKAPAENPESSEWLKTISNRKRELYGEELLKILNAPIPASAGRRRRRTAPKTTSS